MYADRKKAQNSLKQIIDTSKNTDNLSRAISFLFPTTREIIDPHPLPRYKMESLKTFRKISNPQSAERYFTFFPSKSVWSYTEFDTISRSSPEFAYATINKKLSMHPKKERYKIFQSFLENFVDSVGIEIPLTQDWFNAIIRASLDILYEYSDSQREMFGITLDHQVEWALHSAVMRISDHERFEIFMSSIPKFDDMSVHAPLFRRMVGDVRSEGASLRGTPGFSEANALRIRDALLNRIHHIIQHRKFWNQAQPSQVIWFWWGIALDDSLSEFLATEMESQEGALNIAKSTISYTISSDRGTYPNIQIDSWEKLIDLDRLKSIVESILDNQATLENERSTAWEFIEAFSNGINRR